jgi:hypothetical protein
VIAHIISLQESVQELRQRLKEAEKTRLPLKATSLRRYLQTKLRELDAEQRLLGRSSRRLLPSVRCDA